MTLKLRHLLLGFGLVVLILIITAVGTLPGWVEKQAVRSFPEIEGEKSIPGLEGPVEIYRDMHGIPHIYARTHHDLFLAQGYVHAQDRFWQMDFWRHQGAGRLTELLGKSMLENDKFLRTVGWERIAIQEYELMKKEEREILTAYSAGVNAYLQERSGAELSLEYVFLPVLNRRYEPAPWTPINTLTWGKAMAWDLKGNLDAEIERAILLKDLTTDEINFLYPDYPPDRPLIIPNFEPLSASPPYPATGHDPNTPTGNIHDLAKVPISQLKFIQKQSNAITELSRGGLEATGSNSWVISGSMTDTGKPYLANDPHLSSQMPSIWYEVGLHCLPKTDACQLDVTGFSFAGVPGVIIGHNDHIAWGMTNLGPDVMDLYIEKIHPEDPTLYLSDGEWKEMDLIIEEIQIPGKEPLQLPVYLTEHGPLIGEVYGQEEFAEESGLEIPEQYALSLRWTALEPSCVFCAVWDMNLAKNWEEFRKAAEKFDVPSQNLVYADIDGNIGYQTPGNIPIRQEGHNGMLPVPGWTTEYQWQGYIPFAELPYSLNPPEGFIITANNKVVDKNYPYLITLEWSNGYRAQRIQDMIEMAPRPITMEYLQQVQGDNYDLLADDLIPVISNLEFSDEEFVAAQQLLVNWDRQAEMDSGPAALYMIFWQSLRDEIFQDDLPEDTQIGVESRAKDLIRSLINDPNSSWWDDQQTDQIETRDQILFRVFQESVKELSRKQGDPQNWSWGELHTITFHHQVMTNFPVLKTVFDSEPLPTSGGNTIINATGWDPEEPFEVDSVPSMRMIVDFYDLKNSLTIHTTGQSGHAYHTHYLDMADRWRFNQYHPMLWDREAIIDQAEGSLFLTPEE